MSYFCKTYISIPFVSSNYKQVHPTCKLRIFDQKLINKNLTYSHWVQEKLEEEVKEKLHVLLSKVNELLSQAEILSECNHLIHSFLVLFVCDVMWCDTVSRVLPGLCSRFSICKVDIFRAVSSDVCKEQGIVRDTQQWRQNNVWLSNETEILKLVSETTYIPFWFKL